MTRAVTQEQKAKDKPEKLSKSDPDFYRKIAKKAGQKLKKKYGKAYFSKLAKLSHPRAEYNGGRPKNSKTTQRSGDA